MKRVVIDASVVLKWYLPDEAHGEKALSFLNGYMANTLIIVGPSLLEYEVINGLIIAHRRGRFNKEKVISAVEGFLNLGITLVNLSEFYHGAITYCNDYNCSVYDASYLALAREKGVDLITADERLYNNVKKDLDWVKLLDDV